jgi:hypothetical protein
MYNCYHTLFKSKDILLEHDVATDYRRVIARNKITRGSLLLVEHGMSERGKQPTHLLEMLRVDKNWYNSLYPRRKPWSEKLLQKQLDSQDIILLHEKIAKNCFDLTLEGENKGISLFNETSFFNSSLEFNAGVISVTDKLFCPDKSTPFILPYMDFVFVTALKDIEPHEEIMIFYNLPEYKIENYLEYQAQVLKQVQDVLEERREYFTKAMKDMLYTYVNSDVGLQTLKNQTYAFHGFYQGEEECICTPDFDQIVSTFYGTDKEGLQRFDEWVHNILCSILY